MISLLFAALMAGAPSADPAAAASPAAAAAPAKAEKTSDPNKLVCKKEPVLGSRMPTRTCMTQAEWDARKQDSRDQLDAAQRNIPLISH
ncbi:MAG: hypothetical protein JF588_06115 [Caulobacterales bacterium]|nr:hypothetical protein [Caulobacterales bacterium]